MTKEIHKIFLSEYLKAKKFRNLKILSRFGPDPDPGKNSRIRNPDKIIIKHSSICSISLFSMVTVLQIVPNFYDLFLTGIIDNHIETLE